MKQLVKASVILLIAQVCAMAFKLVNTKFLAVFLEPFGLGIFNQIAFFYNWIRIVTTLGTRQGVTKYVSEYYANGKDEEIKSIIVTLFCLLFCVLKLSEQFLV